MFLGLIIFVKNGQKETPEQHVSPLEVVCLYRGMLRSHSLFLLDCLRVFGERKQVGFRSSDLSSVKVAQMQVSLFFLTHVYFTYAYSLNILKFRVYSVVYLNTHITKTWIMFWQASVYYMVAKCKYFHVKKSRYFLSFQEFIM